MTENMYFMLSQWGKQLDTMGTSEWLLGNGIEIMMDGLITRQCPERGEEMKDGNFWNSITFSIRKWDVCYLNRDQTSLLFGSNLF